MQVCGDTRHYITFILYQPCPTPSKTTGASSAPTFPASTQPRAGYNTWHPPQGSPQGTGAQLPQGWTLSIPDGQHPTRIPGGARAVGRSQHCRFSSHGAGQEGFAAPQDRARSEPAPAPGGRQSSGHGQPEGHSWDRISMLLWPPGWGMHPRSRNRHARQDSWLAPSLRLRLWQREEWPRGGSRIQTAGLGHGRERGQVAAAPCGQVCPAALPR